MNSEKLSTIEWILFELDWVKDAERSVREQKKHVIKYTPWWFASLFIIGEALKYIFTATIYLLILLIWIQVWINSRKIETKQVTLIESNNKFCPMPEYSLRSPSLIPTDPNDQATTIGGTNTTFPWSTWDEWLAERLAAIKIN